MLAMITGGVRSGKSRYALQLARQRVSAGPKCFLATAQPFDDGMKLRIRRHREERGADFFTVEEPVRLAGAIKKSADSPLILVDCLTVWLNNLLFRFPEDPGKIQAEIDSFFEAISARPCEMILVTNEIGLGVMPDNPLARKYADELGKLNQEAARICDEVIFMVSGIAKIIKGEEIARLD